MRVVDPHAGSVRRGVEPEDDALTVPATGGEDGALIPDVTHVVMDGRVDENVVIATGNGHGGRIDQWPPPPTLIAADALGVDNEVPEAVEATCFSSRVVLRSEHDSPFFGPMVGPAMSGGRARRRCDGRSPPLPHDRC